MNWLAIVGIIIVSALFGMVLATAVIANSRADRREHEEFMRWVRDECEKDKNKENEKE